MCLEYILRFSKKKTQYLMNTLFLMNILFIIYDKLDAPLVSEIVQ